MRQLRRKVAVFSLALCMAIMPAMPLSAKTTSEFDVSTGIKYEQLDTTYKGMREQVNLMTIDLQNEYAGLDIGLPEPIDNLMTTTAQTRLNHKEGHRVVGAVNASFFTYQTNLPLYLLMRNDILINAGTLSSSNDYYVSEPIAFGVDKNGEALIDRFDLALSLDHKEDTYEVASIDRPRLANGVYVYTPSYPAEKLDTNKYGVEFFVQSTMDKPFSQVEIGEPIEGKITAIREYGEYQQFSIPENGFIISASGGAMANKLSNIKVGDDIELNTSVDRKWKDGEFMLGSGPMLVDNGKVDLSMDPNSSRARERAPRTAVAVDRDENKVFLVTVDGRQTDSAGMNLTQFADYLVSLGADQALNLDGGGSTAMAVRRPGDVYASLANDPSDGTERAVSATLQAISTAPNGVGTYLTMKPTLSQPILSGASINIEPDYLLDQYLNPQPILKANLKYDIEGNLGDVNNRVFTAQKAGNGVVTVKYQDASKEVPVEVVEEPAQLKMNPPSEVVQKGERITFTISALTEGDEEIYYEADQVQWDSSSNLRRVSDGTFEATTSTGEGSVTATLGGKTVEANVVIGKDHLALSDFDEAGEWDVQDLRSVSQSRVSSGFEPVAEGSASMNLQYDFNTNKEGTAISYLNADQPLSIVGSPDSLGMWVYGDGNNHWLRGTIIDGNGKERTIDFTGYKAFNWQGWKYAKANIPSDIALPIELKNVYIAEPEEKDKDSGSVYFDGLEAIYSDSYYEGSKPASYEVAQEDKEWNVKFNTTIEEDTVTKDNIYVLDNDGKRVDVDLDLVSNGHIVTVTPSSDYRTHGFYKLVITDNIKSIYDGKMKQKREMIFQIH